MNNILKVSHILIHLSVLENKLLHEVPNSLFFFFFFIIAIPFPPLSKHIAGG
jgi:hypothetical protein